MKNSSSDSYKEAGVDITAGYESVNKIKPLVESTYIDGVIGTLGSFAGLFKPDLKDIKNPVFVSGTDGVGTKLKLAFLLDKHDTIGIDCVAMCVNDIVCGGATPLFFLDYIACDKNYPEKITEIVKGITDGCKQAECALVGGETAEMPGFYNTGEYDLAGFSVGMVDEDKVITSDSQKSGDVLIGLPSSGVHSNGFSLVRKIFDVENTDLNEPLEELDGKSLGEVLLTPTKIYVKPIKALLNNGVQLKGISHITGGGFYENIPRMLKEDMSAKIDLESFPKLKIFNLIQKKADISDKDMYNTFNMGLGMIFAVDQKDADKVLEILKDIDQEAYKIGELVEGNKEVLLS